MTPNESAWERLEDVLEHLLPLLRRQLSEEFPGVDQETFLEATKTVILDLLEHHDTYTPESILAAIRALIRQSMS